MSVIMIMTVVFRKRCYRKQHGASHCANESYLAKHLIFLLRSANALARRKPGRLFGSPGLCPTPRTNRRVGGGPWEGTPVDQTNEISALRFRYAATPGELPALCVLDGHCHNDDERIHFFAELERLSTACRAFKNSWAPDGHTPRLEPP